MSKSYFGQTKEIGIEGEKVILVSYTYAVQKQITQLTTENKTLEAIDLFLESTIKDWSLVDDSNNKLAINRQTINTLSGSFVNQILSEAVKFNNLTPAEIKNFGER